MARLARAVIPGLPHHVTQRGNRRQQTFFGDEDYGAYLALLGEWTRRHGVAVWSYCLMPNHAHVIAVPAREAGLRLAIGETHRRYTRRVNFRERWRGHLWEGRFASFVMDEAHLLCAARYVELNPVRAGLVGRPEDWPWSSAAAHLSGEDDALLETGPLLDLAGLPWDRFLELGAGEALCERMRLHERTGRPLAEVAFVEDLERRLGRPLRPQRPGRKPLSAEPGGPQGGSGGGRPGERQLELF